MSSSFSFLIYLRTPCIRTQIIDTVSEKDKAADLELIRLGAIDCGDKTIEESACVQEETLSTSQEKLEGIQGPGSDANSMIKGGGEGNFFVNLKCF